MYRSSVTGLDPPPATGFSATTSIGFGRDVKAVEVTLANAGIHYRGCYQGTAWSCQGRPQDDDLPLKVRATAVR